MTSCLMNTVHDYLISTTHVSAKHAPYYVRWVRQVYEIAGDKLSISLFRDYETRNIAVTSASSSLSPSVNLPARDRRFYRDFCWIRGLLPLDGCGRLTGDVVDDTAHLRYLPRNLLGDFIHKLCWEPGPIRRHPVYTTYRT